MVFNSCSDGTGGEHLMILRMRLCASQDHRSGYCSRRLCSTCSDLEVAEEPKESSAVSKGVMDESKPGPEGPQDLPRRESRRGSKGKTPPSNESSPKVLTEEEKAKQALLWQQALSQSLANVAECIHSMPPGLEHMEPSLTKTLVTVAEECRNVIPGSPGREGKADSSNEIPYSRTDVVEMRLTELESKFHLLHAYAKANAHAIARAYNRSCVRLSDLLCPLLDKSENLPPEFPDTLGNFHLLSGEAAFNLLATYQVPEIPPSDEERRIDLARYIGVNI